MELGKLIEGAFNLKASDIHLVEGSPPYLRINDDLRAIDHPPLSAEDVEKTLDLIFPPELRSKLEERRSVDFGYAHKDTIRCRINVFYRRRKLEVVLRLIPKEIPTLQELEMPEVLQTFVDYHRGLVLVTGPTGCGKSTTLAAIIDGHNAKYRHAIITIEDPVEYVYENKHSVVSQRELGDDVPDFSSGIIQAMRQDPDVILVGEMRDMETIKAGLLAAETGHLVLSTLHTSSAVNAIDRMVAVFPQVEHQLVRDQVANHLRAIMTQELVRRAESKGRIAAVEILICNDHVGKLIREDNLDDIYEIMKNGHEGMQTLDLALAMLAREKKIAREEGARLARNESVYNRYVKGIMTTADRGGVLG